MVPIQRFVLNQQCYCNNQILIMVDLSEYSSDKLMKMNEPQLKQALEKYKKEQMPLWKIGVVVGYHGFALAGMYYYAMKLRGKRVEPSFKNRHQLTVINMFRKGSVHALLMISLYAAGLALICHNNISLPQIRKLTEIQTTYDAFGLRFDPSYQQYLLFARMRKFDLSEELISQIREELNTEKVRLIEEGGLLPETIQKIKYCEEIYKDRANQVR